MQEIARQGSSLRPRSMVAPGLGVLSARVKAALDGGVVSTRMIFPESGLAQTVEIWQAPIIQDAELLTAIRQRLQQLDPFLQPAGRGELLARILVLLSHYRLGAHAESVERGLADDWAEDLGEYPMWVVEDAARHWRRSRKFKPQISEIVELCEQAYGSVRKEGDRLQAVLEASQDAGKPLARATKRLAESMLRRIA